MRANIAGLIRWMAARIGPPQALLVLAPLISLATGNFFREGFPPQRARRVLILRLDEIGDLVLTSGLIRELRHWLPEARITLAVATKSVDLAKACPHVDEVLCFDAPSFDLAWSDARRNWAAFLFAARALWRRRFDIAMVPRWDTDVAMAVPLAFLSGAPIRVGFSEAVNASKRKLNDGYHRFLTHAMIDAGLRHEAERPMVLLKALGCEPADTRLDAWTRASDDAFAERFLRETGPAGNGTLIALAPGARQAHRMWPWDRYVTLAQRLHQRRHSRIVLIGGPSESDLCSELAARMGPWAVSAAGSTLPQTSALLRRCALFVGNDSAPAHLAAAVGIPVTMISCHPIDAPADHANSPARFGPWTAARVVLQPTEPTAPCREGCRAEVAHCIAGVSVQQVYDAVYMLLAARCPYTPRQRVS